MPLRLKPKLTSLISDPETPTYQNSRVSERSQAPSTFLSVEDTQPERFTEKAYLTVMPATRKFLPIRTSTGEIMNQIDMAALILTMDVPGPRLLTDMESQSTLTLKNIKLSQPFASRKSSGGTF